MESPYNHPVQSAADVQSIVNGMELFFQSGATLDVSFRIRQLRQLQSYLLAHEKEALEALHADLGKSAFESYETELGLVFDELRYCLKHIRRWTRPRHVATPLAHFPTDSVIYPYPFGVTAVLSPWNYPLQLSLIPLVDALTAGNCVIMKPSKTSPCTSAFLRDLCEAVFDPRYVFCLHGSDDMNKWLLEVEFDKIMFTGSPRVGKMIMHHAADSLTSVNLELGGKSPLFIDKSANLKRAGARVAWGKCLNSGQTCVAPDYALVHENIVDGFVDELERSIREFYGDDALKSPDYPHMINEHHFQRVCGLIDQRPEGSAIAFGGGRNPETLQIQPTVVTGVTLGDPLMSQEIFGPVLPVLTWSDPEQAIEVTRSFGHPLACYIFSDDRAFQRRILNMVPSGGATINDVVIHASSSYLPFGGLQNSGIGAYHGKAGFDAFTHYKSTMRKGNWLDLPVRYPPFDNAKLRLLKLFIPDK